MEEQVESNLVEYPKLWRKAVGYLIDAVVWIGLACMSDFVLDILIRIILDHPANKLVLIPKYVILLFLAFLFSTVFCYFNNGKTIGHFFMKLRVIQADGKDIKLFNLILRQIIRSSGWLLYLFVYTSFMVGLFPNEHYNAISSDWGKLFWLIIGLPIVVISLGIWILDFIVVPLCNFSKLRTLHDFLSGTMVIVEE